TCSAQPDGKLVILAADGVQKTVRVLLRREHRLVVEKVGLRFLDVSGFTDASSEMWATKVDNTYNIDGRMPPNTGEMTSHQFEIETTCRNEVPPPYAPPPPRGAP
ncbi:MAG TPA: lipoprotein LpqH, partial [Mycobacterium sp.]|nr:lipoprotein LpqH [Mycobacterium sp.]